jgi:hypothetical protein
VTKVDDYRRLLRELPKGDWAEFLRDYSGLPGPRGNLELIHAVGEEGPERILRSLEASDDEYLVSCGVVGMGRMVAEGKRRYLAVLRTRASDERWRVREAVAMALQRIGDTDMGVLFDIAERWSTGGLLEQRALAAGLCEPRLLERKADVKRVLRILDRITANVARHDDRKSEDFRVLRKALAYCWSVAVVAHPVAGKPVMEKWLESDDRDVAWLMKQNLKKTRLARMDPEWVAGQLHS